MQISKILTILRFPFDATGHKVAVKENLLNDISIRLVQGSFLTDAWILPCYISWILKQQSEYSTRALALEPGTIAE